MKNWRIFWNTFVQKKTEKIYVTKYDSFFKEDVCLQWQTPIFLVNFVSQINILSYNNKEYLMDNCIYIYVPEIIIIFVNIAFNFIINLLFSFKEIS